ncbi:MAG: protein O-GlcNAcase [Candidatus Binatia bacterium]
MSKEDVSSLAVRGVIEGFYGKPFSHEERMDLLRFLGRHGYDCYVYAPKDDPRHREQWRDPYPEEDLDRFRALAEEARCNGVRLFYAIAPGLSYDASDAEEFARLAAKIHALVACGVRGIALLFDDLMADSTTLDPQVQAVLVRRTHDLVRGIDPELSFWFIGNFYCGDAAELAGDGGFWRALYGRSALDYFAAYAEHVQNDVPIMWTGPAVFSATIRESDASGVRTLVRRPVVLWDNFPVNDTLRDQLFLGPYVGREPGAVRALHGVVLNLMSQATANRIPLATAAEFLADPDRYDPDGALSRAIAAVSGDGQGAAHLAAFVAQHRGHPVLASGDTAHELAVETAAAFGGNGIDHAALARLRAHLVELSVNDERLAAAFAGSPLLADVAPWSAQLRRLALAGLAGLDALTGAASRDAFVARREDTHGHDRLVAATRLPQALQPFAAGAGETVDRFADLFAAIDARLAASGR